MSNTTLTQDGNHDLPGAGKDDTSTSAFDKNFPMYVGIGIGAGILLFLLVVVVILLYKRGTFQRLRKQNSSSTRRLYFRGFSTVSQRGAIDSTAEFEIVNTVSVSSEGGGGESPRKNSKSDMVPKKPERKRTRTTSNNVKYENVTLDSNAGFVVRKSVSMSSGIPYMDNTLESRLSEKDEDLDDVFH